MALGSKRWVGGWPVVVWILTLATWSRHWLAWAWRSVRSWKVRSGQKLCRM